jgi:hypothetical protein
MATRPVFPHRSLRRCLALACEGTHGTGAPALIAARLVAASRTAGARIAAGVIAAIWIVGHAAWAADAAAPADGARGERRLGQYSGYEGREEALGRALAPAMKAAAPAAGDPRYDFTGRERALGLAMTQVVRTLNHNQSYQHEINDALVKLTLDHIMFAKRNRLLDAMVTEDVNSQRQQLERVRRAIERTGNRDLALVAIFEQTACFFQLVDATERAPGRVSYVSPYRTVLEQTVRMGIHQLTEREIHEVWTIPRMQAYAKILGVPLDVSPWQADGRITIRFATASESSPAT